MNSLKIGDYLLVDTKYGTVPIRVTRFEILDECPVDIPIKTVIKKLTCK